MMGMRSLRQRGALELQSISAGICTSTREMRYRAVGRLGNPRPMKAAVRMIEKLKGWKKAS